MTTPRRFSSYPKTYGRIFLKAHREGQAGIQLETVKDAKSMRAHLYAFRSAAMDELPEDEGDLLLILPEARTRIEGTTLIIFFDPRNKELANAAGDSSNSGVPVEN